MLQVDGRDCGIVGRSSQGLRSSPHYGNELAGPLSCNSKADRAGTMSAYVDGADRVAVGIEGNKPHCRRCMEVGSGLSKSHSLSQKRSLRRLFCRAQRRVTGFPLRLAGMC